MDPTALNLFAALAPEVHELDQAAALEACGALVKRMRAHKLYHEATRAAPVDVGAGELPRLTNRPEEGPPAPLADKTMKNFQANVCHVFRGVVGACVCTSALCGDCAERLKVDEVWFLAVDDCLEWAYKNQGGGQAATRTALERVLSLGQLCDMHHSPEAMRARDLYRKHASSVRGYHESINKKRTADEALLITPPPAEEEGEGAAAAAEAAAAGGTPRALTVAEAAELAQANFPGPAADLPARPARARARAPSPWTTRRRTPPTARCRR